jgi:hypothetical protein
VVVHIAVALACVVAAGCGRLGFDLARGGTDPPIDASGDAPRAPIALDPGFPIVVNLDATAGTTIATPAFSTPGPDRLLVGVFVWGTGGTDESPLMLGGAGVTWTKRVYTTFLPGPVPPGTSGDAIWTAWAADPVAGGKVIATRGSTVETAVLTLAVYSFANAADAIDATGTHTDQTTTTPLLVDVEATAAGSWIVGGFHHGTAGAFRTPTTDTVWDITDDATKAPNGHFHAIGRYRGVTTGPGTIKIGSATAGPYSLTSAVEVLPR